MAAFFVFIGFICSAIYDIVVGIILLLYAIVDAARGCKNESQDTKNT